MTGIKSNSCKRLAAEYICLFNCMQNTCQDRFWCLLPSRASLYLVFWITWQSWCSSTGLAQSSAPELPRKPGWHMALGDRDRQEHSHLETDGHRAAPRAGNQQQLPWSVGWGLWGSAGDDIPVLVRMLCVWVVGEGNKSLEMQLQLPLRRRKLVLLLSPPTVLGCNIKVEECRAGAATHYATVPIRALLSLGPSLLLNCAYLRAGAPCSYLGSPFPLDVLPFSILLTFASCCLDCSASLPCLSLPIQGCYSLISCLDLSLGLSLL